MPLWRLGQVGFAGGLYDVGRMGDVFLGLSSGQTGKVLAPLSLSLPSLELCSFVANQGTYETLNEDDIWELSPTMQSKAVYTKFSAIKYVLPQSSYHSRQGLG